MDNKILLEICVDDVQGLLTAARCGADRIELCSSLSSGGLTPSLGLMQQAAKLSIPTYAMIRPRAGSFIYDEHDLAVMKADIAAARAQGLAGVVFGATTAQASLDLPFLRQLVQDSYGLKLTLHRAFDTLSHLPQAIDQAIELGFERILTSGGAPTARDGLEALKNCFAYARNRIIIMPGAGVTAETAPALCQALPIKEIHASCATAGPTPDTRFTDAKKITALKQVLFATMSEKISA